MTEQEKAPPVTVWTKPDSRLESLLVQYDDAKSKADEAAARLKTITDGIKAELSALGEPGKDDPQAFNINSPYLKAPLRLSYQEEWRLDTKRMKAEAPETYVRWAKQGGKWVLKAVQVDHGA